MTAAILVPATAGLFAFTGVGAVAVIVDSLAGNWPRIAHILRNGTSGPYNGKAPIGRKPTGVPSLHMIAGRRSTAKVTRSFPSQARRGALLITIAGEGESFARRESDRPRD